MAPFGRPESSRDRDVASLLRDTASRLEKYGELTQKNREDIADAAGEIARMRDEIRDTRDTYAKRFAAIAGDYAGGGSYRGPFASMEHARQFGQVVAAVMSRNANALDELQRAGIVPGTGAEGGFALAEQLLDAIFRNVEEAGAFEANCPAKPVDSLRGGGATRTSGLTVYFPDYSAAGTVSTPGLGTTGFDLKRFMVGTEVDNWMLNSKLAAALGDFVASEIAYGLALTADQCWFIGDGTDACCRYTGLFKRTDGLLSVTGDSGDDTFKEMIDKSTYYLAQVLGIAPLWVHQSDPAFYMHLLTYFGYWGVRDTAGRPIADVMLAKDKPQLYLMGYPVQPVQVAPSATAVSTTFALFGALKRACGVYRHANAVTFKSSADVKFWEGATVFAADVPQDMCVKDGNGIVQLKTAAS